MISGVAFCPQAPALVPAVGRGLEAELGPVREACRAAIRRVATPGTQVVVVGGAAEAGEFGPTARGSFAGYGVDLVVPLGSDADGPVGLPASLAVGAWLVRDALGPDSGAIGFAIDRKSGWPELPGDAPIALVVLGEGSGRLTEKAPGYLDERAVDYDERLRTALRSGDGWQLNDSVLDPRDGAGYDGLVDPPLPDVEADLLVRGHWVRDRVAAYVEPFDWDAELLYDDAPFGVGYYVAAWTERRA